MRIAVVSDIHGNRTAFEAVLRDLGEAAPDLVLQGGDLADSGSGPEEIVDWIRELGWQGVMGNRDEMLVRPESLELFAASVGGPEGMWAMIREMAEATREALGEDRLAWLRRLPMVTIEHGLALVHATPASCWKAAPATEEELEAIYAPLGQRRVASGHTHVPSIRWLGGRVRTLINCGSVGLPYDGDPRASYLLLDEDEPTIRRVEYDVEAEIAALARAARPGGAWVTKVPRARAPQMP
jgi:predicted phosphodiesterase